MDVFEVAIGEFVSSFGVLSIPLVDCQMPLCILAKAVLPNEFVLELGRRAMLPPGAFSIRDEVPLFNELHAKGESGFVYLQATARLSKRHAGDAEQNCDYDGANACTF